MFRLDEKFTRMPLRYLIQCSLGALATAGFLSMLEVLNHIGLVAALGATTFMVFTMPHRVSSRPRYLIGGYSWGVLSGVGASSVLSVLGEHGTTTIAWFGAASVGVTALLMVATDTEHPPAAGVALGLVLQTWDYRTIIYVMASVIFLSVVRRLLSKFLIDLL